jgi:hypothetical protein
MFSKELQFWEIGDKFKKQKLPEKTGNQDFMDDYVSPYANTI